MTAKNRQFYLEAAEDVLVNWHSNCNKQNFILATYLWGSILREDFDPAISDIDGLAIVDAQAPDSLQKETRSFLSSQIKGFTDFKINILYKSELDGGQILSGLARTLPPQLILFDIPNWKWLAGKKFIRSDFALPELTMAEAIAMQFEIIDQKFLAASQDDDYSSFNYFRKNVCILIHLVQELKLGRRYPFSYYSIVENADADTKRLAEAFFTLRPGTWDMSDFKKMIPVVFSDLENLRQFAKKDIDN